MRRVPKPERKTFVYNWNRVPVVIDVAMVCILLGICENTALSLIRRGDLPAKKVGQAWRINRSDLMQYLGLTGEEETVC